MLLTQCRSSAKVGREQSYEQTHSSARTGSGEALAFEDVTEVTAASRASDLDALHTPSTIHMAIYGAGNGCIGRNQSDNNYG
jgi:hypothetical protein